MGRTKNRHECGLGPKTKALYDLIRARDGSNPVSAMEIDREIFGLKDRMSDRMKQSIRMSRYRAINRILAYDKKVKHCGPGRRSGWYWY